MTSTTIGSFISPTFSLTFPTCTGTVALTPKIFTMDPEDPAAITSFYYYASPLETSCLDYGAKITY